MSRASRDPDARAARYASPRTFFTTERTSSDLNGFTMKSLAPASMAAGDPGATPDWSINWHKVAGYVECGAAVYLAVGSGFAMGVVAVAVCARVYIEQKS